MISCVIRFLFGVWVTRENRGVLRVVLFFPEEPGEWGDIGIGQFT